MAEIIKSGRKYRQKKGNDIVMYSFWGLLKDIFCDDGINAQTKITSLESSISLLNQNIKKIQTATSLPSDAASHTDTLYIITD